MEGVSEEDDGEEGLVGEGGVPSEGDSWSMYLEKVNDAFVAEWYYANGVNLLFKISC